MGKYDSDDDSYPKRNKLGILTHDNSDKRMKLMLVAEGTWFTVEKTKKEAWWTSRLNKSNATSSATPESTEKKYNESIDELTSSFEKLGGTINIEKAEEYDKKSSKAVVVMMNYLSPENNMTTQDCNTAWEMWVFLQKKYRISASSILTASIYIAKIVKFHESLSSETSLGLKRYCNVVVEGCGTGMVGEVGFASKKRIIIAGDIIGEWEKAGEERRRQKSECNYPKKKS
jgi:hypothetical protein